MALSIPIVSEFDGKGIDKAIKEFKQLETAGEKAQLQSKKRRYLRRLRSLVWRRRQAQRYRQRQTLRKI